MALFVQQKNQRSELQEKLAAEMKDRMQQKLKADTESQPAMLDGQNKTRPAGLIILALITLLVIVGIIVATIQNGN
ncbi:MAG TPA: hypothetical protein VD907_02320 [Verrucomicrobiae bacterium]|nr:hypothetical protein [Verrucomicrobiae bacterium]